MFWIIFRLAELVAAVIEPAIAEALVKLVSGVDTVMMVNQGIELEDVLKELDKRSEKTGNLKTFHQVDKNT